MHPLILTPLYPPAVGGAATYFGDIAAQLARREEIQRLTILTERLPGQPPDSRQDKLAVLRHLPTRVSIPRRPWLLHALTYIQTQRWFATHLPGLLRTQPWFAQTGIDLIHFHTRYGGQSFYRMLRRSGLPVIADLRDKMIAPQRLVGVCATLMTCGEGVRQFAIAGGFPEAQTTLVPIPFTLPESPTQEKVTHLRQKHHLGNAPFLLFIGDITRSKGVFDLLAAYRDWRKAHPETRLVMAGVNREGPPFSERVAHTPGTRYLGKIPHSDVLTLMKGAAILILPSRSEGLPRVILEAVALGTKVVCPPNIPEFDRHLSQFVLPEVSPPAIRATLERVWKTNQCPAYPLHHHHLPQVVTKLIEVYRCSERDF
ncbi:MAG: glycosyltransferase family 4 protein [Anaerolineales bacterium]